MGKTTVVKGLTALSRQECVAKRALKYIGHTDCNFITKGAVLLQYNIMAPSHAKYKSTIAYKYGW